MSRDLYVVLISLKITSLLLFVFSITQVHKTFISKIIKRTLNVPDRYHLGQPWVTVARHSDWALFTLGLNLAKSTSLTT
jgi:hypothetical protein